MTRPYRKSVERRLGQKLGPDTVVDHVNADHSDDTPSNLRPMERAAHSRRHTDPSIKTLAKLQRSLGMVKRRQKLY